LRENLREPRGTGRPGTDDIILNQCLSQSGKGDFRVPVWSLPVSCGDAGILEERLWYLFATPACEAAAPLLAHVGKLVIRDSIRELLWKDGTNVDFETGINRCIRQLRTALSDHAT
jgi:hypothetical protein